MIATHRVKDSNDKTTGFIVDGNYQHYYNTLNYIKNNKITNLHADKNNVIKSVKKSLQEISIKEVHSNIYKQLVDNNPLSRDIQSQFEEWKKSWSKYVLYLTGARQTGKTTELLKFAYKNYEHVIYINLAEDKTLADFEKCIMDHSLHLGMMHYCEIAGLFDFDNSADTLLIIDEIQVSHTIYNRIRALQNELNCHIAVTGSYLGKILNSKYFKPAGNMYEVEMLPLSFREFCRAFEQEKTLLQIHLYGESEDKDYQVLTDLYKVYIQIGGYPAVVSHYISTQDITACHIVIKTILDRVREEAASQFLDDKSEIIYENVYKAAFLNMTKEKKGTASKDIQDITTFVKEDTKEHVSRKEVNAAISWLKYVKLIGSCDLYNQGNVMDLLPERRFFFMDCGVASYIADLTAVDNDTVNGLIAETFAYTELYRVYKAKEVKGDKPCCSVCRNFELDFMIVDKQDVKYGIEIKSKQSNEHKSLDYYLTNHYIDEAYLAQISRGGIGNEIRNIPIYTVGCRFPYK